MADSAIVAVEHIYFFLMVCFVCEITNDSLRYTTNTAQFVIEVCSESLA